jgi:hypothetical protein
MVCMTTSPVTGPMTLLTGRDLPIPIGSLAAVLAAELGLKD